MLEKVVFLDRDGVINRDSPDYVKTWEEFEFLPGSLDAISLLTRNSFTILIITNTIHHRSGNDSARNTCPHTPSHV